MDPGGQQAATTGQDGVIRIWDLNTGKLTRSIPGGPDVAYKLEYLPGARLLAAGHAGNLTIWGATPAPLSQQKVPGVAYSATVFAAKKRVAIPCADGKTYFLAIP